MKMQTEFYDIGVIGLGVMGKNLALNISDNHYRVSAFDLDALKVTGLIKQAQKEAEPNRPLGVKGCDNVSEMLAELEKPRIVVLSVPAGGPVDGVCQALIEAGIEQDDIVIDTGNSLWTDTIAREKKYRPQFTFFSCAVSGGEVGARFGPSLMPSGDEKAWLRIQPIWEAIAAKVDGKTGLPIERTQPGQTVTEGEACTSYIGPAGSGHYVKMVHNGIEYADMQLICEAYHLLSQGLGLTAIEISAIFERWNQGSLNSYLMEISADILKQADPVTSRPLVELILDKAGQKGTGLWTAVSSLQIGCPAPTIAEAVYARALSTQKSQRVTLSTLLSGPNTDKKGLIDHTKADVFIDQLENALYCAKVSSYAQGFQLMAMMGKEQGWQLDFAQIAKIWRAGCIIRATFLQSITQAYQDANETELEILLMADTFSSALSEKQNDWRQAVSQAVLNGIPAPCISSALAYYDSYRSAVVPANLLQAQRDFFGAHTFERVDAPIGEKYHLNWSSTERKLHKVN